MGSNMAGANSAGLTDRPTDWQTGRQLRGRWQLSRSLAGVLGHTASWPGMREGIFAVQLRTLSGLGNLRRLHSRAAIRGGRVWICCSVWECLERIGVCNWSVASNQTSSYYFVWSTLFLSHYYIRGVCTYAARKAVRQAHVLKS
jgi:hypothetical protein